MPVNHDYKLAFIHIPKTGGVSIANGLKMVELWHHPASYYAEKYPEYVRFTVIRAHNDRIKSVYRYIKNPPLGKPDENALNLHIKDFSHWIDEPCHYYLRFEHMEADLNKMLKHLGHPEIKLQKLNATE